MNVTRPRPSDADDFAARVLVGSPVFGLQAGGDRLAALLDETGEIVGQLLDIDCHCRGGSAGPCIFPLGLASGQRSVSGRRGLRGRIARAFSNAIAR
jgi:hypothetical protein